MFPARTYFPITSEMSKVPEVAAIEVARRDQELPQAYEKVLSGMIDRNMAWSKSGEWRILRDEMQYFSEREVRILRNNFLRQLTDLGIYVKRLETRFNRRDSEVEAAETLAHSFFLP